MPWELLRPAGLALFGLIVPLTVLYVLKVERQRRVVSSTWLYRATPRDQQAQRPFKKLIPSIPLFLELSAIAALALAASGPVGRSEGGALSRVVLVVDVSASMGAVENGETRLQRARRSARQVIEGLAPGTELMLLAAGRGSELISPFERDRRRQSAALERLSVHEVEGQLGPALAMASEQLREGGKGKIVLVTDAAIADADSLVAPNVPLSVIRIDGAHDNTAIVRTDVARSVDPTTQRDRVEVFAVVAHNGRTPRDVFVTLRQRNASDVLASRHVRLAPGERVPVVLGFESSPGDEGTGLFLELSPKDALESDDRTAVRVPFGRKLPVVLAPERASVWVERALNADPDVELFRTDLEGLLAGNIPEDALVVVDGACPERLPGGDLLILNPPRGACRTLRVGGILERPVITSWTETDARLRHLTFEGVEIAQSRELIPERPADALVRTRQGVLIADASSPGRNATLVGFDVGASNWPLRASFVLFVRNVIELARSERENSRFAPARTGEPIRLRVPLDVDSVSVENDSGQVERIPARSGLAVIPAPTQVGFLQVSWAGNKPKSELVPTSLSSEAESRLDPRPIPQGTAQSPSGAPHQVASFDWAFALVALLLVALDVFWTTRTPRRLATSGVTQ